MPNGRGVITPNLLILSFVSLLNDFSTDMVAPLLPYFVKTVLLGGAIAVGIMEGTAESLAAFFRYFSGRLSDKLGRRKLLTLIGYSLSGVSKIFYGAVASAYQAIIIRGSDRVGKGFREAPRDAILSESIPRAYWGFGYGFHRMLDTTGALLGPLAALIYIHVAGDTEPALRRMFYIAAIPGLLGLLLFFWVRETGAGPDPAEARRPLVPRMALHGPLARYLGVTAIFTIGHLAPAFLVLRAYDLGIPFVSVIYLYICYNAVEAVAALPVGNITDRLGRAPILVIAYASFAATFGLVAWYGPDGWWQLLPFFLLMGGCRALREGQGRAFVADLSPGELRATSFGAYHGTIGLLALPAGFLAGFLWEIDYRWSFGVASAACALACLLFLATWRLDGFAGRPQDAAQDQQGA